MRKELEVKAERAIKLIQSASKIAAENGCPEIKETYGLEVIGNIYDNPELLSTK